MQIGFNNDVEHDGVRYHIQTEDHGLEDGRITSQVFRGGQILDTITVSYKKAIAGLAEGDERDERDEKIRKRMKALHSLCFRNIKQDKYDEGTDDDVEPLEVGAELLDKPKMPSEPAPAPGIGKGRPLTGLRKPPPPSGAGDDPGGLPKSLSDTDEDEPVVVRDPLQDLDPEELVEGIVSGMYENASKKADTESEERATTLKMEPLPGELPEGIRVAGAQDDLGDLVFEHARGPGMDAEELARQLVEASEKKPSPSSKAFSFSPMYSPQTAFRGLDVDPEPELPALLEALAG